MNMLELKNVYVKYHKGKMVLQDIVLQIPKGQFVSIVGSSGAGKTTLLRLFNRMVRPSSGEIWIDGVRFDLLNTTACRRIQCQIGMVLQDFGLVEESSCIQNVLNGCLGKLPVWRVVSGRFPEAYKRKAHNALAQVGLEKCAAEKVTSLSGGQKQRVAIARALMQDAIVLLADEPVASLDPMTAKQILELLRRLQIEKGLTVVMNSHNVEQAKAFSDRIVGLKEGRIYLDKRTEQWQPSDFSDLYRKQQP